MIRDWVRRHGYAPNTREIGDAVGLRSASSVSKHLKSLEERGFLRRSATVSRPIDVRMFLREPRVEADESTVAVPVLGDIAAGTPILAEQHPDDSLTLPRELVGRGTVFGLRVRGDSMVDDRLGHLVNPTLDLSDEQETDDEGCLSLPGLSFPTPRAVRAVAKGFNMHGEPITLEGTHMLARCVQHETDHLDGIIFIDRMDPEQRKAAMKAIREAEWFGDPVPVVKESPHPTFGKAI